MKIKLFFILWLLFSGITHADIAKTQQKEIEYLISYVDHSDCIFNRNGINYTGSEAVTHIKRKYDYFKKEIETTEDFIELAATKSELSGKKYTVKCKKTEMIGLGKWLHQLLNTLRKKDHKHHNSL